jgi:hypothetical protein
MKFEAPKQPTLREIWGTILPRFREPGKPKMPLWPPDVFALCAYALKQQSRYVRVVSKGWPPLQEGETLETWAKGIRDVAMRWLSVWHAERPEELPAEVSHLWDALCTALDKELPKTSDGNWFADWPLMKLASISDEACMVAFRDGNEAIEKDSGVTMMLLRLNAQRLLVRNERSSICEEVPPSKLRVLPKDRAPQKGFTIRSLSLWACLIDGQEIVPRIEDSKVLDDLTMNILVIPWPFVVQPSQIEEVSTTGGKTATMPPEFGFFTFRQPALPEQFCESVVRLLDEAEADVGRIRLVLLPELALEQAAAEKLADELKKRGVNLVCGVGTPSDSARYGENYVYYSLLANRAAKQNKHHRWKLDEAQIRQYSAGSQLHISGQYWEHIDLSNRTLSFVRLQSWLNTCVLICEDLARPDPVGDIVRAVGPNLTIALLLDGPQLRERWPARHATILAEDPGSSVLTVTSLGMSELSKPIAGPDRSRVIALWKESGSSSALEIEMPMNKNCAVLSLSMRKTKDWAADGRSRAASTPVLTGVRFFGMAHADSLNPALSSRKDGSNA